MEQILRDLAAKGNMEFVAGQLGISVASVHNYYKQFGINGKHKQSAAAEVTDSPLKQVIDDFLVAKEVSGKTKATIVFYSNNLRRFLWWLEKEGIPAKLSNFTPAVLRRFLHYLQTSSERFGGLSITSRRPVNRTTIDAYWRTFQALGKWLINEEIITESPVKRIERPGQLKPVIPDIPLEKLKEVLNSFPDDFIGKRNRAICYIFLDTGIRLNELVSLTSDRLLDGGLLKVFGKGQKERIVRLSPATVTILNDYLALRKDGAHIWTTTKGKPLQDSAVKSLCRKLGQKFGVKMNPHAFRHTFAINYLRAGGDPFTLQMLGGWTDLDMPRSYAAALKQEDALKIHQKASPVEFLIHGARGDN